MLAIMAGLGHDMRIEIIRRPFTFLLLTSLYLAAIMPASSMSGRRVIDGQGTTHE
ncbi:MAG TPA: hypothetical protein VIS31_04395 [Woeseiaceae bacterium]